MAEVKELQYLFNEYIERSRKLRPSYPKSLSKPKNVEINVQKTKSIPNLFKVIYSTVEGTKRDIKEQSLMDFIPNYRLIHIDELEQEKKLLSNMLGNKNNSLSVLPFLSNYSSDFLCYVEDNFGDGSIYLLTHDDPQLILMHHSPISFFKTINEFYKQNVYFLDEDGYLDLDWDKEGEVGLTLNPDIDYWRT